MGKKHILFLWLFIILAPASKMSGTARKPASRQPIVLNQAGARVRERTYTIVSSQPNPNDHVYVAWSILICTLPQRKETFQRLYNELMQQIQELHLQDHIEILSFEDDGQHSIGFKRNMLLQASRGEYVNFLDDDDMVHKNYIYMIYSRLRYKPDCISLTGIQTTNGANPVIFIQSLVYDDCYEENGVRCLPPHHTNTIKRSIASQFAFPHICEGEDREWALNLRSSGLLQHEIVIEEPYYFYYYTPHKSNESLRKGRRNHG